VRLLFLVPIYALISFASYLFWVRANAGQLLFGRTEPHDEQNRSTPLILIRDCYEGVVLTSFFYLLLTYLSPNPDEQKEIFRLNGLSHENDRQRKRKGQKPQKWVFPLGFVKSRPEVRLPSQPLHGLCWDKYYQDGLYFLQIMKWAVLQYCVIRPAYVMLVVG